MEQDYNQQISDYIVLGRDGRDQSYFILQYDVIQTREAEAYWCRANQSMTVGEVVRGKLLPSVDPKVIGGDKLPTSEHQEDNLPTLLVED